MVGVVVTREPEWDEPQREAMFGLAQYEAGVHSGGCGYHGDVANDPGHYFTFDVEHCLLCANLAREERLRADADADEAKRLEDNPHARRAADGRRIYLRPMLSEEVDQALAAQKQRRGGESRGGEA